MKYWKSVTTVLMLLSVLTFVSGCEFLLEEPRARTNPNDENSPVYYFRATPQYNTGSYDQTKFTWMWSADAGHNQGEVLIMGNPNRYPTGLDDTDSSTITTYGWSSLDTTSSVYTHLDGNQNNPTVKTWYYAIYYTVKGDDRVYERYSPKTVFNTVTSINIPCAFAGGMFYDGSTYSFTGGTMSIASIGASTGYIILVPDLGLLPSYNIDVASVDFHYNIGNVTSSGQFTLSRISTPLFDDGTPQDYHNFLSNISNFSTVNQAVLGPHLIAGNFTLGASTDLAAIINYWLDTFEIYGLRAAASAVSDQDLIAYPDDLTNTYFTVNYVGPTP